MAAKYRKIDPRIWTDESFVELDSIEKLVALNAITGQSNRCGFFQFSFAKAAEECGLDSDSYARAMGKVCDTLDWKYDRSRRVLYIPTWWKYNPPENPKHLEGCLKDLADVPDTLLLQGFASNMTFLPDVCHEGFKIAMGIAMANQEQKQEREQKRKPANAGLATVVAAAAGGIVDGTLGETSSEPSGDTGGRSPAQAKAKERKQASGPHHELIRFFCDGWRAMYDKPYAFNAGKDGKHVKWILSATALNLDEAKRVIAVFLADTDDWLVDRGHTLGLLVSRFNQYRVAGTRPAGVINGQRKQSRGRVTQFAGAGEGDVKDL